jgi:ribosomal protein L11 methyltransferase
MIRLAVRCAPERAEGVLAELVELVPGGVEEDRGAGWVEYAIYGPPGELPSLPDLEAAAGEGLVEIETTEIPDDWADRWRDFHEPVQIGERLVVRPSWEEGVEGSAGIEVVVDPGQAFGTGAHATTAMCLELLLDLEDGSAKGSLADLGTGSGVLAIAAAKLGWGPIHAYDHEPAAVEAARANAALNGVRIAVERLNLRDGLPAVAEHGTWVANLTSPLLVEIAAGLGDDGGGRPAVLVASGLLGTERERVEGAFAAAGYEVVRQLVRGDWAALLMRR